MGERLGHDNINRLNKYHLYTSISSSACTQDVNANRFKSLAHYQCLPGITAALFTWQHGIGPSSERSFLCIIFRVHGKAGHGHGHGHELFLHVDYFCVHARSSHMAIITVVDKT